MSWETILKKKKRRTDNPAWKPMSPPKIRTDNDIKVAYIDKMIGIVDSVSYHNFSKGSRYTQPKYDVYSAYFDMGKLGGNMVREWVLNWLDTLKNAFKQNKTVSRHTPDVVDTLKKLEELVHEIIKFTNPPHYDYLELQSLDSMGIYIDGERTTVDFDIRRLMEEQL